MFKAHRDEQLKEFQKYKDCQKVAKPATKCGGCRKAKKTSPPKSPIERKKPKSPKGKGRKAEKRKQKKIIVVSSDESEDESDDSLDNEEGESSEKSSSSSPSSEDQSSGDDSSEESEEGHDRCSNPFIDGEAKVKRPKKRFGKKAHVVPEKQSWSDKKKKLRPKKRISRRAVKGLKRKLRYRKRPKNSVETSENDSDNDQQCCSKGSPKKRKRGGGNGDGNSKLTHIERQYVEGFESQVGDSVRTSEMGIDLNVRITDLNMKSVRNALYRMFRLMQGRQGYVSMTAGALLRSLSGDTLRLWYTSSNGINITFPGRPYLVMDLKSLGKLISMIKRNLEEIINNCFLQMFRKQLPLTVRKNAKLDHINVVRFPCHLDPLSALFACLCAFLRSKFTSAPLNKQSQNVLRPAKKLQLQVKRSMPHVSLAQKGGCCNMKAISKLSCLLQLNINVWTVESLANERLRVSPFNKIAFEMDFPEVNLLRVTGQSQHKETYYLIKNLHVFLQRFPCEWCTRSFSRNAALKRHKESGSCMFLRFLKQHPNSEDAEYDFFFKTEPLERVFHCGKYIPRQSLITRIEKLLGLRLTEQYRALNDHMLSFDIETCQAKPTPGNPDEILVDGFVSVHETLSISVCTDIPQLKDTKGVCFINFDNDINFLHECLDYMLKASDIAFNNNKKKYGWLLNQIQCTEKEAIRSNRPFFAKQLAKLNYDLLAFMKKLCCFGYNSSSFDLCVLRNCGFFYLLFQKEKRHPRAMKRGHAYQIVDSGNRLLFLDVLNFLNQKPSLRKFLKDMNVPLTQSKLYFWYDMWTKSNSQRLLWRTKPPSYRMFYSRLKNVNVLEEEYLEYKRLRKLGHSESAALGALELTEVPLTGRQQYKIFRRDYKRLKIKYWYEYLARYCSRDTTSLMLGIKEFQRTFLSSDICHANPFFYSSLSSLAFPILVNYLAKSCKSEADFFCSLNEEAFHMLKSRGQIGGLCELIAGSDDRIKPHQYGKEAETAQLILSLDLNTLYAGTIGKRCTTVAGFYAIRRKSNAFRQTSVMEKHHMAHSFVLFMEKMVLQRKLKHALSVNGEKKLVFQDGTSTFLDAWLDESYKSQDGKTYPYGKAWNFHGCFIHACYLCYAREIESGAAHPKIKGMTWAQVHERTKTMDAKIRQHPQVMGYHIKYEHEWLNDIKENPFIAYFVKNCCGYAPPMVRKSFSEDEAVKFVMERKIVGFCECSLYVPDDLIEQFIDFPPIFVREEVRREHLKPNQRRIAENRNAMNRGQTTILSKFSGDDLVISTDLFIWYVENGLKVKELKTIIQFHENLAFQDWLDCLVLGRRHADAIGSTVQAEMYKLIGNGSYGFASLDLSRRLDVHFGDLAKLKYFHSRPTFYQAYEAGTPNQRTGYVEIQCKKYRVKERLPLQFSCEVLSTSKRILFETIYGCFVSYFQPQKWCMLGADTNGVQIAISGNSLDEIIQPRLTEEWKSIKHKWLVPQEDGPLQKLLKRHPLLLKLELQADLASVHLASKSYIMVAKSSLTKSGHKGISSRLNPELITLKEYVNALFSDGSPDSVKQAKLHSIRQTAYGEMGTFYGSRAALSNLSVKLDYCDSGVHCFPRDLSEQQLLKLFPHRACCDIVNQQQVWREIVKATKDTTIAGSAHVV